LFILCLFLLNLLIFFATITDRLMVNKDINCKTVDILFYLLFIQLTVYNRTITRFIADNKVAHQRVR